MKEKVFNLFLFIENEVIVELGACCHEWGGADAHKLAFLQREVSADLAKATRFPMPKRYHLVFPDGATGTGLQYQSYQQLAAMQQHLDLFEEVFIQLAAPQNPLICITPIVDGKPRVEAITRF